jgi:uncharacterized hydrophobic protein (TIGR00271 family)
MRLHLALPGDLTAAALEVLEPDPAVSALEVYRGAALRPAGDVVEADVAREATNEIVDRLRELGLHEVGTLHLTPVNAWMSQSGFQAEQQAPGSPADTVVWAEVTHLSYDQTELNWSYSSFMSLATLLAAIAIVIDSPILVIGAMVLGPEFAAIAALGVALVRRRGSLFARAATTLLGGFAIAMAITFVAALVARGLGWVSVTDLTGARPGTAFIYTPDRWSFVVAVIAAAAGVLSLTSSRVGGLSGVFISVTTIPAAANVSLGLAFGEWGEVWGSSAQLLLNITGMVVAGWLTLTVQQLVWARVSEKRARALGRR